MTTAALNTKSTETENKLADTITLLMKTDYNTKIPEIKKHQALVILKLNQKALILN